MSPNTSLARALPGQSFAVGVIQLWEGGGVQDSMQVYYRTTHKVSFLVQNYAFKELCIGKFISKAVNH